MCVCTNEAHDCLLDLCMLLKASMIVQTILALEGIRALDMTCT